eukprot:Sspe_Gene.4515::Locus_1486_Transcript_1_1_Confidence_1.000_Length_1607::g.4515::m.4515
MPMSALVVALIAVACSGAAVQVDVAWGSGSRTLSSPTYQTSIDPKYRADGLAGSSNISKVVFENMKALRADRVRHVPWFPYPRLAVAELKAPGKTCSWNFTLIDPITEGVLSAVRPSSAVLNFATIPEWMFEGGDEVVVPEDANIRFVGYEKGTVLKDRQLAVDYFTRLAQYYTGKGFTDECGVQHVGPDYSDTIQWWEVLNEPTAEHGFTPENYTLMYDAVVASLQKVNPKLKFVGLALGSHNRMDMYSYFLNRSNHAPGIPLDGISYHQYVIGSNNNITALAVDYFAKMDTFVDEVRKIETLKASLSPETVSYINEIGCGSSSYFVDGFYQMCAATYAYLFAKAAPLGVGYFGMSQVIGFTGASLCPTCTDEWPSTSMVNWYTGEGNARYWVLKIMIDELGYGAKVCPSTTVSGSGVAAQGFVTAKGERKVLVVNTLPSSANVTAAGATRAVWVDQSTGDQFGCSGSCYSTAPVTGSLTLGAFGVAILTL